MQVFDRPKGPVQLKDRHGVKAVLNGVVLELPPGGAMEQVIRAGLVDLGLCNVPVGMLTDKLPQGQELSFRILVFVAGADSSIEGNARSVAPTHCGPFCGPLPTFPKVVSTVGVRLGVS